MDIHYNAFISYRHHPQDIKVAEAIHRGLEHFQVPKALKKKLQKDTKLRLFRDKEELPITSNLSDDITKALRNSDFLIVICSTHTKESMWVQREIETFLQTHDYSRVFTVLVDGEPYDTIPPILCSQEQLDPVTGEKKTVPLEPLSCDWRVGRQKAYREELPRLAAALLGCGYDELRQRQRQYRIRRMVTAASIACSLVLAFSGYVLYNSIQLQKANDRLTDANAKIQSNLMAALENQSQYLSSAAMQNLDDGDRMLAMALAMEALPEYDGERPYVTQAEYALSTALYAYSAEGQVAGVGRLSCDALIQDFDATDARDRMFVIDQLGMLSVWDLNSYSKLHSTAVPGLSGELMITPQDTAIFIGTDSVLYCYDKELNLLWSKEDCYELAFSTDRETVLAEAGGNTILFLNAATGEEVYPAAKIALPADTSSFWSVHFCQEEYDLNRPILLQYSQYGQQLHLVAWDLQKEQLLEIAAFPEDYLLRRTAYTAKGNVVVLAISESSNMNGKFGQMMTYSPVGIRVMCFSTAGNQLWETPLTSYGYSNTNTLGTIVNTETHFCQVDNLLVILDENTGEVITTCQTGAMPVWAKMNETYASVLLEDGSMGNYYYNDNQFSSFRYFKENISRGFAGNGAFLNQSLSRDILVYKSIRDQNFAGFEGTYSASAAQRVSGNGMVAIYNYDAVCIFSVADRKLLWTVEETAEDRFQLLKFTDDSFWFSNVYAKELRKLDLQTGEAETFPLPETTPAGASLYYRYTALPVMTGDHIYLTAEDLLADELYLVAFDIRSLEASLVRLCAADDPICHSGELLTVCNETAYLWVQDAKAVYAADVQTGLSRIYLEGLTARPTVQLLADGQTCLVAADNQVRILNTDNSLIFETELAQSKAVSGFRSANKVYILTDAGTLLVYDLSGQKLSEIALELYSGFYSTVTQSFDPASITWDITNSGDLLVSVFRAGNLIHGQTNQLRSWIPNCVAYSPDTNEIVTLGKEADAGTSLLGVYPCYSTEDILEMTQEALGSYCLTSEQKEEYGIS